MANPYTPVSIANYNLNPPSDDGTEAPTNRVNWSKHKEKLADPLRTLAEGINTNVLAATGKLAGGVTSVADDYTVLPTDQGKTIVVTVAAKTITTPSAASVGAPFKFSVKNSSSGDITVDGSGSQTVDGVPSVVIPSGRGVDFNTDGANWFTSGINYPIAAPLGSVTNGTFVVSVAGNALTVALKTLAGADPAVGDLVTVLFRSPTLASGVFIQRAVVAPLSIVVPSTATLGAANGIRFELFVTLHDEAGSVRIGVINPLTSTGFYMLDDSILHSSTVIGTGSDSAGVIYTDNAVSNCAIVVLGNMRWDSGLTTAGTWNAGPEYLYLRTPGARLPAGLRPLLHVRDEKASGTDGGTFTAGSWQTRTLNTEKTNEITGASIASNQITLPAGTYWIQAKAPAFFSGSSANHKVKLYNITDAADAIIGSSIFTDADSDASVTWSDLSGRLTIAAQKVFELRHMTNRTRSTDGFGVSSDFSVVEVYSEVFIWKER